MFNVPNINLFMALCIISYNEVLSSTCAVYEIIVRINQSIIHGFSSRPISKNSFQTGAG